MASRNQASPGQKGTPDLDTIARYLKRTHFPSEAARAAKTDPACLRRLTADLRQYKKHLPISPETDEMEQLLHLLFGVSVDVFFRKLQVGEPHRAGLLVGIDGLVDTQLLATALDGLLQRAGDGPRGGEPLLDWLAKGCAPLPGAQPEEDLQQVVHAIMGGQAALFLAGSSRALLLNVTGGKHRGVTEPETESVIRGPREGFVESLSVNTALLRRRLRDERFCVETLTLGTISGTRVAIAYIDGVTKQSLVDEAKQRLGRIKIDGILDSGYLEEFIEDTPYTVFPLVSPTERPDVVAAGLLQGRLAILSDGSPFAIVVPALLVEMFQAPEDYYERFPVATFLRVLRFLFGGLSLLGPSLYVAFTTFHTEMIPTNLLLSIMSAREGVPFPALVEALGMELTFEALREAGVRMPKQVGQAMSIVGALVIGQAAVQAGIVSAPMVIVVAITGIATFMIPRVSTAIALRLLRFPLLFLAGTFGAYGIVLGLIVLVVHLLSLRSFGAPYLAPFGPWMPEDLKDTLVRQPLWAMRKRPKSNESLDPVRADKGMVPGPQHQNGGKESR